MHKQFASATIGLLFFLTVSFAYGQKGGKGNEKGRGEKEAPKGGKSEPGRGEPGKPGGGAQAGRGNSKAPGGNWADHKPSSESQHGAAAGAAAANRNEPKTTGKEGAAAGAAAANRNNPQPTGAQGAAAGAAAANRNNPKATGAQGAAAGAAVANRNAPAVSGAGGAALGYASVRNSFDRHDMYGASWYGTHANAWTPVDWAAGAAWTATPWSGLATHFGYGSNPPVSYGYGTNVTYVNGNVMLDGQAIGTGEEFSQQAADLAQRGADAKIPDGEKWLPLGVFALVRNEQQHPQLILQMAIDSQGNLRGNYTDETTDITLPLQGAVDKKTQRAAWTVGSNPNSVMEAGLSNLSQDEAPALLHKNGKTERWMLVRMQQPQ